MSCVSWSCLSLFREFITRWIEQILHISCRSSGSSTRARSRARLNDYGGLRQNGKKEASFEAVRSRPNSATYQANYSWRVALSFLVDLAYFNLTKCFTDWRDLYLTTPSFKAMYFERKAAKSQWRFGLGGKLSPLEPLEEFLFFVFFWQKLHYFFGDNFCF